MLNGTDIQNVFSLRTRLSALKDDEPLVLQVERAGHLQFVVLESN